MESNRAWSRSASVSRSEVMGLELEVLKLQQP